MNVTPAAVDDALVAAYDAAGPAWDSGPALIYGRLAEVVCERCPVPLAGTLVLDVGSGTGVASAAAGRRGAAGVVAVDVAIGMLAARADATVAAVAGDAGALPFAPGSFGAVLAAFSLNHLEHPAAGLQEMRRVLRPGGGAVVSSYGEGDGHPVKSMVESAAWAQGWRPPEWYERLRERAVPRLATVERAEAAARAAGLRAAHAERIEVPFPGLTAADLVAWRMGMAQLAPFVASLGPPDRRRLAHRAMEGLGGDFPVLVRSIVVLSWTEPGRHRR